MCDRLRAEGGFTIVEAVITVALTLIISTVALSVLDRAYSNNDDLQRKSAAQAQGRAGIDVVTRLLRSQVCRSDGTPPVAAADANSVTFYADFGDASPTSMPEKHVIAYDATTKQLTDTKWKGGGTLDNPTYTGAAVTRVLANDIAPDGGTPILQYFAYSAATPPTATVALNSAASPAVAGARLADIARIVVTLRANPPGRITTKNSMSLQDEVFVRLSSPDQPVPSPTCA